MYIELDKGQTIDDTKIQVEISRRKEFHKSILDDDDYNE